jgi:hypothetical protein
VFVPGRAQMIGQLRPAGDQGVELRLRPEHRKGAARVDVVAVDLVGQQRVEQFALLRRVMAFRVGVRARMDPPRRSDGLGARETAAG